MTHSSHQNLNTLPEKVEYAYKLGQLSYEIGKGVDFNPYNRYGVEKAHLASAWKMGWDDASEGIVEKEIESQKNVSEV